jgi:hypothetical protein
VLAWGGYALLLYGIFKLTHGGFESVKTRLFEIMAGFK